MRLFLALTFAILLPAGAWAAPSGTLTVSAIDNTGCGFSSVNPNCVIVIGTGTATNGTAGVSYASAQADLGGGTLAVSTSSDGVFGHFASALAEFWDTFAFSGVMPGQKATVTISGTATTTGSSALQYFADLFQAGAITPPNGGSGELIPLSANGHWSVSATFNIANGSLDNGAYVLNAGLRGSSQLCGDNNCPGSVDASATVTLTLPDNVVLTADSPVGLPEPSTFLLLGTLPALAWVRRRRG